MAITHRWVYATFMDISEAAAALGRRTSPKKKRTARQNGKLGGRPRSSESAPLRDDSFPAVRAADLSRLQQLSVLRYPGGKGWLLPWMRAFVKVQRPQVFLEPFAGGAVVGLTLLNEDLVDELILVERDPRVCAFWRAALGDPYLAERVRQFRCTRENVERVCAGPQDGFWTLVSNRCKYGGLLDRGLLNVGDGRGVRSRWNGMRLYYALRQIRALSGRIRLIEGDGMKVLKRFNSRSYAALIDPPYSVSEQCPGKHLYRHHELDHPGLFTVLSSWQGRWAATYNDTPEVVAMANAHGYRYRHIPMLTKNNKRKRELLIWK